VIIIARGIELDPGIRFSINVSGGLQREQGDDSRIHCIQFVPPLQFAYGCCRNHPPRTNAGDGRLVVQLDGTEAVKTAFQGASTFQTVPTMLTAAGALQAAVDHQRASSVDAGWPIVAAATQPPPP
jgi:hypothetical protein